MIKLLKTLLGVVLTALLLSTTLMTKARAATSDGVLPQCTLASGGIVVNVWAKHRIFLNEEAVFGANDLGTVVAQLKQMRQQHLCQ